MELLSKHVSILISIIGQSIKEVDSNDSSLKEDLQNILLGDTDRSLNMGTPERLNCKLNFNFNFIFSLTEFDSSSLLLSLLLLYLLIYNLIYFNRLSTLTYSKEVLYHLVAKLSPVTK